MEFTLTRKGKFCVLHLAGSSISHEEKEDLHQTLLKLTEKETHLAINLSKLIYANSQLLSQLLVAHRAMGKKNAVFVVIGPKGSVMDLLRITDMIKVFKICEGEIELDSFS